MSTLHLVNWNVNGIRSIMKKDFVKDIQSINPEVLCLQETKASYEEVKSLCELLPEYKVYVNSSKARKGYSGTAILSKTEPLNVTCDMDIEEHDQEGRVITAEYEQFFLVTIYVPNSGDGLKRLDYREKWDADFTAYVTNLSLKKPVIICGDLNVAHRPIDIARDKQNYNKSAGYTQREIDGFNRLLDAGFTDTFRYFYPDEVKYTYWNVMFNARSRNIGWRIDYFLVSNSMMEQVKDSLIYNEYLGSDHCPIGLMIEI
ncbi:exodeoxyribonuclease III [Rubrolithibacter danxiaensis]|uniref:exodeoxyribonuclease III n=1 Tax=Rubrolithibacter danxiaensis TaxID=3390805 RepID=UPI003BF7F2F3